MRTPKLGAAHARSRRTRSRPRIAAGAVTVVTVAGLTTGMMVNSANGAPSFVPPDPVTAEKVQTPATMNLSEAFEPVPGLSLNLPKRGLYLITANLRGKIESPNGLPHKCFIVGDLAMNSEQVANSERIVVTSIESQMSHPVDVQSTAPISMLVNVPKGGATVLARAKYGYLCLDAARQIITDDNGRSTLNAVRLSQ